MAAPSRVVSTVLKGPVGTADEPAYRAEVRQVVEEVIADVRERGDAAVREYSQRFDKWAPEQFGSARRRSTRSCPEWTSRCSPTSGSCRSRSARWRSGSWSR